MADGTRPHRQVGPPLATPRPTKFPHRRALMLPQRLEQTNAAGLFAQSAVGPKVIGLDATPAPRQLSNCLGLRGGAEVQQGADPCGHGCTADPLRAQLVALFLGAFPHGQIERHGHLHRSTGARVGVGGGCGVGRGQRSDVAAGCGCVRGVRTAARAGGSVAGGCGGWRGVALRWRRCLVLRCGVVAAGIIHTTLDRFEALDLEGHHAASAADVVGHSSSAKARKAWAAARACWPLPSCSTIGTCSATALAAPGPASGRPGRKCRSLSVDTALRHAREALAELA